MRALILHGPGDLRLEEVPDPRAARGEVVVRVDAALTCATDAKMVRAGAHPALGPLPAPLGHEVAGTVLEAGDGVAWPAVGDAVVVANSAPCGACRACREGRANLCESIVHLTGAFAERLRVPAAIVARNTLALPAGLAPALAAMAEPIACALHSAARCGAGPGDLVLILGGGAQGQLLAGVLAERGCRVHVADPHPDRRGRALRFGAEAVHEAPRGPEGVAALRRAVSGGGGADVVVEAVGRPETWRAAAALARPGGEALLHGGCPPGSEVRLPTGPLHYQELTLRGSYHHTPDAVRAAVDMLAAGALPFAELLGEPIGLADVARVLDEERGAKRPVLP
ncbi:MAG TPA: alcohol dehydrogenase catalytic domain-containing protein [Miltoncostaeaceae bacterium]|nr:alcohol dehydrogenase catalytic domain-containing protein [Miltoncostaeaceae bacterium]